MKKDVKICTVVTGKNLEEFLNNLKKVQKVSDFIELRVDYIEDLKLEDLDIIKKNTIKENIFTCRSLEEGGLFKGSTEELLQIIYRAIELEFNHIDIEVSKLDLINISKCKENVKIIGSYHNFKETPNLNNLNDIVKKIADYDFVSIAKLATMSNNSEDTINLTKLLINNPADKDLIVLGMGEEGKITRIISPLLGGYLTFASLGECKSASGQINLDELKKIYKSLKNK